MFVSLSVCTFEVVDFSNIMNDIANARLKSSFLLLKNNTITQDVGRGKVATVRCKPVSG